MIKLNKQLKDYRYLFLDMDSFFASVEQQVRPNLRNKPIAVTPFTGNTGCIIAPSIEAKQYGVKTGQLVKEGKRNCSKLKVVEARPKLYLIYHEELKKALKKLTPFFASQSVDEFKIKLSKREQNRSGSIKLAKNIKKEINQEIGDNLSLSIGIGPNSFLAKLAGEEGKPNGLQSVKLKELTSFYRKLELTDLTGIGNQMKKKLIKKGISTPLKFYRTSLTELINKLGVAGRSWYYRLKGYELSQQKTRRKSIGHSHVLPPEFRDKKGAQQVIKKLIHKVGRRLRSDNQQAQGVSLSVSFFNGPKFSKNMKTEPFNSNQKLNGYAFSLLRNCKWHYKPRKVAVRAFNLAQSKQYQPSLFKDVEKSRRISKAIDRLNDKLGQETIYQASMHLSKETAPDRISFGKPKF